MSCLFFLKFKTNTKARRGAVVNVYVCFDETIVYNMKKKRCLV
jgi:hypothetical protein